MENIIETNYKLITHNKLKKYFFAIFTCNGISGIAGLWLEKPRKKNIEKFNIESQNHQIKASKGLSEISYFSQIV
jgi:hypothetical protein